MRLTHEKLLKALEEVHCYVHNNLREQKVAIIPLLVKWLAGGEIACRLTRDGGGGTHSGEACHTVTPRARVTDQCAHALIYCTPVPTSCPQSLSFEFCYETMSWSLSKSIHTGYCIK